MITIDRFINADIRDMIAEVTADTLRHVHLNTLVNRISDLTNQSRDIAIVLHSKIAGI